VAARTTLANIIRRTRLLIDDPGNAVPAPLFSDEEVQEALDENRLDVVYLGLQEVETILPGGQIQYLEYYAKYGDWEDDLRFQNNRWDIVVPDVVDNTVGKWSFTVQPLYPLYVTGKRFDRFVAAADLLDKWVAKLKLDFTFSSQGQSFSRKEKIENLKDLATDYRKRQTIMKKARMTRPDINNNRWG